MRPIGSVLTFGCFLLVMNPRLPVTEQDNATHVETTLCDLYQNPRQYTGKIVKVRGTVAGDELWIDTFTEKACPAYMRVTVVFPERVVPAPDFDLVRDESFKQLEAAIYHARPIHIEATFEGRFDGAFFWRDHKRIRIGPGTNKGYGKRHDYDGRIVLRQVSDVEVKPLSSK